MSTVMVLIDGVTVTVTVLPSLHPQGLSPEVLNSAAFSISHAW